MKKSGLTKDKLKQIWIIAARTDPQQLERDEFNIALRLIALAQNNMEVSEESIKLNHPLPPLPKFDLKNAGSYQSKSQSLNNSEVADPIEEQFAMTDEDVRKYTLLFNKNKDLENTMSINKAQTMWTTAGVALDTIKKILILVPLQLKSEMNFNEFKVIFHLIYKSYNYDLPTCLPSCLKNNLEIPKDSNNNNNINNLSNSSTVQPAIIPNSNFNFGEKININNPQSFPQQIIFNNAIPNSTILNTNKSMDIESLIANELTTQKKPEVSPIEENIKYSVPTTIPSKIVNQTPSPIINNNIPTYLRNTKENLGNVAQELNLESQFLNKIHDEDNNNLTNLIEEIDKLSLNIKSMTEKNKYIRENILEVRKKINMEKDNLTKLNQEYKFKNQELAKSQDELNKITEEYNNLKKETNQYAFSQGILNDKPTQVLQQYNYTPNLNKQDMQRPEKNSASPLLIEQDKKENSYRNPEISFAPSLKEPFHFDNNNKNASQFSNKQPSVPLTNFNSSETSNKPSSAIEQPKNVNKSFDIPNPYPNNFDFDNKFVKQPAASENNTQPINTEFNFEGFDGMNSFKDFQEKQSDDIFRKSDFGKWDDF